MREKSLHIPYIEVFEDASYNYTEVISGSNNGSDAFYDYRFKELDSKRKEPLGVSIGAGIPIKKSKILR